MVVVFLSVLKYKKMSNSTKLIIAKRFEHQFVFALPKESFIVTIEFQSFCPFVGIRSPYPFLSLKVQKVQKTVLSIPF